MMFLKLKKVWDLIVSEKSYAEIAWPTLGALRRSPWVNWTWLRPKSGLRGSKGSSFTREEIVTEPSRKLVKLSDQRPICLESHLKVNEVPANITNFAIEPEKASAPGEAKKGEREQQGDQETKDALHQIIEAWRKSWFPETTTMRNWDHRDRRNSRIRIYTRQVELSGDIGGVWSNTGNEHALCFTWLNFADNVGNNVDGVTILDYKSEANLGLSHWSIWTQWRQKRYFEKLFDGCTLSGSSEITVDMSHFLDGEITAPIGTWK